MKKFYAFAAAAMMAATAFAQNGAPLYATGAGQFEGGEWAPAAASEFAYVDGVYTLEVAGLTQFKISTVLPEAGDNAWNDFNAGALTCEYGEEQGVAVELVPGDANIATPWKGDYTITVAGDLSTITLTTTTPAPTGPVTIYLRGDMNGWGNVATDENAELWPFTRVTDNVLKYVFEEGQAIGLGETFKVADADWNTYNFGGSGEPLMLETDTELVYNGGNLTLEEPCNGVVWVILDLEGAAYFWASNDKDGAPEWAPEPDSWGVVGGFNGWGNDVKMTEKEAGVWTVTIEQLEGEFKFRKNGEWADNYGASAAANITGNGEYGIKASGDNFNIAAVENVTLTLDINRGILVVETESLSGVAGIEAVDAPARYFNLQGVEVANPSNGVYIVVKGNKASKAVVK